MNQPPLVVRAAVLTTSITLVAALVVYRADAFPWQTMVEPVADDSGMSQKSAAETLPVAADFLPLPNVDNNPFDTPRTPFDEVVASRATVTVSASGSDGAFLSSSKSGRVLLPPSPTGSGSGSTIMYSSKDGVVFPPNSPTLSASAGTVLAGSKSD